ncbi:hypothetical protein [Actinoplanes sp. NPDC049599]|uniref:hypothetical protein n=1 Tax=Actinoplanes sp. NPDC049599 TaxID=3363903 RepID=UPI00378E2B09
MIWTGRTDEAAALGLLLDRTYADAAAAAAHPRLLDREFLIGQFDLWDNHLLPAVAAGTAPLWKRRSAARAVWRRLGFMASADHRRWMAGHLDGLGLDPAALLGAERDDRAPFRSGDGRLIAAQQPVTARAAELIHADYDLTGGAVVGARLDVHGPDPQRIGGFVKVSAGSRRYPDAEAGPPELHFRFGDATALTFPHAGRGEVRLSGSPAVVVTGDGAGLDLADVRLTGRDVTWYPHDALWEESAAARDAVAGVRETAPEIPELAARGADLLGGLQLMIMVQLRMMRHAHLLRRGELAAAATLCGGLNAGLFRARPTAVRARWAARRMREILATQDGRAHALLRHVGRRMAIEVPELPGATAPPTPVRITVGTAARLLGELDLTGSRLRFVDVEPDRTVVHLDVRRGGRETIVVIVLTEPLGHAPLTVTPDGLTLTRPPTLAATADDIALTIPLPGGDWTPRAAAGSWYVD